MGARFSCEEALEEAHQLVARAFDGGLSVLESDEESTTYGKFLHTSSERGEHGQLLHTFAPTPVMHVEAAEGDTGVEMRLYTFDRRGARHHVCSLGAEAPDPEWLEENAACGGHALLCALKEQHPPPPVLA